MWIPYASVVPLTRCLRQVAASRKIGSNSKKEWMFVWCFMPIICSSFAESSNRKQIKTVFLQPPKDDFKTPQLRFSLQLITIFDISKERMCLFSIKLI